MSRLLTCRIMTVAREDPHARTRGRGRNKSLPDRARRGVRTGPSFHRSSAIGVPKGGNRLRTASTQARSCPPVRCFRKEGAKLQCVLTYHRLDHRHICSDLNHWLHLELRAVTHPNAICPNSASSYGSIARPDLPESSRSHSKPSNPLSYSSCSTDWSRWAMPQAASHPTPSTHP
jgi:hypothetical protein